MKAAPDRPDVTPGSPLGSADHVARIRGASPSLVPVIDDLEDLVTPEFAGADAAAVAARQMMSRHRMIDLAGGAVVTAFGLGRLGFGDGAQWCSAAAGLVAAAISASAMSQRGSQLDRWLDHRRLAEELRSLYFRHLVESAAMDDAPRRRAIRDDVGALIGGSEARSRTRAEADAAVAPTVSAEAWRVYAERRLRDQIEWMTAKSRSVEARTRVFGRAQMALMVMAALFGFASALVADPLGRALAIPVAAMAGLVAVVAAVDAVVANERLSTHYQRTAKRLQLIERSIGDTPASGGDISEIESILMAEHRAWQVIAQEGDG
jgi:hypothetical protein